MEEVKELKQNLKLCNKCNQSLSTDDFYKTRGYFQSSCKKCMNTARLSKYVPRTPKERKPRAKQLTKYDRLTEEQKNLITTSLSEGQTMKDIALALNIKYTTFVKYKSLFIIN